MEGNGTALPLIAATVKYLKSPLITMALIVGVGVATWSMQSADLRTARADIEALQTNSVKVSDLTREQFAQDKELERQRAETLEQRAQMMQQLARIEGKVDKTNERIDKLAERLPRR